jgi:hypothetical protein
MSSNNIILSIAGWWYFMYNTKCKVGNTLPIKGHLYLIVNINSVNGTMECIKLDRKSRKQFPYAKKGDIIICPNGDLFTVAIKNLENHNSIYCFPHGFNDCRKSGRFWRSS